mmetsp:Transcript_17630/g.40427  ORF Transcript_17630/g.40427 Transcript_17630/m.40427 type:complete len:291 (-) Transcript_17630:434-1306(-)
MGPDRHRCGDYTHCRDASHRAAHGMAGVRLNLGCNASRPGELDAGWHAAKAKVNHLLLPGSRVRPFGVRRLPARRPPFSVGQSARVAQHPLDRHHCASDVHARWLLHAAACKLLLSVGAHPPLDSAPRPLHACKDSALCIRTRPSPHLGAAANAHRHLLRRHLLLRAHLQYAAARPLQVRRRRRRVHCVSPRRLLLWCGHLGRGQVQQVRASTQLGAGAHRPVARGRSTSVHGATRQVCARNPAARARPALTSAALSVCRLPAGLLLLGASRANAKACAHRLRAPRRRRA